MPRTTEQVTATAAADPVEPVALRLPPAPLALQVNGEDYFHEGDPAMPLLWFLRDRLRLTGTKYACDSGVCGACTVLVDGKATHACTLRMDAAAGKAVTTIEGLGATVLHPLQQAWIEKDAVLCGYCQPGQLMAAAALLKRNPRPRADDLDALSNLCRCGAYPRIRSAIVRAAELMRADAE